MEGEAYKENGIGMIRINRSLENKASYRLCEFIKRRSISKNSEVEFLSLVVMRADATHRLILNATIFAKIHFEVVETKYVRFSVFIENKMKTYLAKVSDFSLHSC